MKPWAIDTSVLLIFFVRDDTFAEVFKAVKEARPRRLLLYQDGPRPNRPEDKEGIARCRAIAEDIDWECEVYRNYQESNWGCDPATFYSHKWAFSLVDKCIVLEDDCVPTQSFFRYCKELLDKYEHDPRVNRICGMNNLGESPECPYDYFFSKMGSVWGWASWRRVAQTWDEEYNFLNLEYEMDNLQLNANDPKFPEFKRVAYRHKASGKPHWESVQSFSKLLNSSFDIVPKRNMIRSIGVSANSTHNVDDIRLTARKLRKYYELPVHEIEFPLNHPPFIIDNLRYCFDLRKAIHKTFFTKAEGVIRKIRYGRFDLLSKALKRRLKL